VPCSLFFNISTADAICLGHKLDQATVLAGSLTVAN